MLRSVLLGVLLLLIGSAALAADSADAQLQLEVIIPERTVMYLAETEGGHLPGLRSGAAQALVFDLSCATLAAPEDKCSQLYGGPLLDMFGQPYPPVKVDAQGRPGGPASFPQYFESAVRTLRFFLNDDSWRVDVELAGMNDFGAEHFAIWTDAGGWRCLGWHEDWLEEQAGWLQPEACPVGTDASMQPITLAAAQTHQGGWQELLLRVVLRIDGSEKSGSHSGVLRYTLVSL